MSRHFRDVNGRYLYRGIELWMQRTQTSLERLAERAGISGSALQSILKGRTPSPGKDTIDRILAATGLTYEEAFRANKLGVSKQRVHKIIKAVRERREIGDI